MTSSPPTGSVPVSDPADDEPAAHDRAPSETIPSEDRSGELPYASTGRREWFEQDTFIGANPSKSRLDQIVRAGMAVMIVTTACGVFAVEIPAAVEEHLTAGQILAVGSATVGMLAIPTTFYFAARRKAAKAVQKVIKKSVATALWKAGDPLK